MAPGSLSSGFHSFTPLPTIKLGPSGAGSRVGGLVHTLSEAPVGLSNNLSCEAGSLSCCHPNPHGAFNQRFEALFPRSEALGCVFCFASLRLSGLSVRECGAAGSASGQTACPVRPTLLQSWFHHGNASPLCPGCPSLPLLAVWMNVYFLFPWCRTSLPFDFQFWLCEEVQCVYLHCHLGSPHFEASH